MTNWEVLFSLSPVAILSPLPAVNIFQNYSILTSILRWIHNILKRCLCSLAHSHSRTQHITYIIILYIHFLFKYCSQYRCQNNRATDWREETWQSADQSGSQLQVVTSPDHTWPQPDHTVWQLVQKWLHVRPEANNEPTVGSKVSKKFQMLSQYFEKTPLGPPPCFEHILLQTNH